MCAIVHCAMHRFSIFHFVNVAYIENFLCIVPWLFELMLCVCGARLRTLCCSVKIHWCTSKLNSSREVVCLGSERKVVRVSTFSAYIRASRHAELMHAACIQPRAAECKCRHRSYANCTSHPSRRAHKLCRFVNASVHRRQVRCDIWMIRFRNFSLSLRHSCVICPDFQFSRAQSIGTCTFARCSTILLRVSIEQPAVTGELWHLRNKLLNSLAIICVFHATMAHGWRDAHNHFPLSSIVQSSNFRISKSSKSSVLRRERARARVRIQLFHLNCFIAKSECAHIAGNMIRKINADVSHRQQKAHQQKQYSKAVRWQCRKQNVLVVIFDLGSKSLSAISADIFSLQQHMMRALAALVAMASPLVSFSLTQV